MGLVAMGSLPTVPQAATSVEVAAVAVAVGAVVTATAVTLGTTMAAEHEAAVEERAGGWAEPEAAEGVAAEGVLALIAVVASAEATADSGSGTEMEGETETEMGTVAAGRASPQRIGPPSLSRAGARDTYETMDLAIHMGVWPEKLAPVGSDAEFDALAGSTPFEGDNPEVERGEGTGPHGNQAPVGPGSTHRMGTSPKSPSRRPRSKSDPTRPVSPRRVWL